MNTNKEKINTLCCKKFGTVLWATIAYICFFFSPVFYSQTTGVELSKNYANTESYFSIENLWDIELISSNSGNGYYFITLKLMNENYQLLYKSKTQSFQIKNNPFSLLANIGVISPLQSEWIDANYYNSIKKSGGMLLPGKYYVEYTLLSTVAGCNWAGEVLFKKVFPLSIEYFNQIELVFPPNEDTLYTTFPNFMWLPLAPYQAGIRYHIKVAEVTTEKPEQSIFLNIPYLNISSYSDHQLLYPASARKLEKNKKYVWMVDALNEKNEILATSRPFSFYIKDTPAKDTLHLHPSFSYLEITDNIQDRWIDISNDTLFIAYRHKGKNQDVLTIQFKKLNPPETSKVKNIQHGIRLNNGTNLYTLLLSDIQEGIYEVKIFNSYDQITYKFYLKKTTSKK